MLFTALFGALAAIAPASAALSKPVMNPPLKDGLNTFSQPLLQRLGSQGQHNDKWGAGWLPARCREEATWRNVNPNDLEAFNVYYGDCASSWVICRHKNAQLSKDTVIDYFGRLPVRMRDYVQHLVVLPDAAPHAVSYADTLVFWGNCAFTVVVHETGHNLDVHAFGAEYTSRFSASQLWLDEFAKDSAVVDSYAQTNQVENLAQGVVVAFADKNIPGGIGTIAPAWNQIYHQYATVQWKLGDKLFQGGRCNRKFQNSAPVAANGKRSRVDAAALGPAPRYLVEGEHDFVARDGDGAREVIMSWFDDKGNVIKSEVESV